VFTARYELNLWIQVTCGPFSVTTHVIELYCYCRNATQTRWYIWVQAVSRNAWCVVPGCWLCLCQQNWQLVMSESMRVRKSLCTYTSRQTALRTFLLPSVVGNGIIMGAQMRRYVWGLTNTHCTPLILPKHACTQHFKFKKTRLLLIFALKTAAPGRCSAFS
jgi:hypothetical protein